MPTCSAPQFNFDLLFVTPFKRFIPGFAQVLLGFPPPLQGPYSYLCSYGGRSFSIIDTETGKMVADSGDDLEDQVYKEAMMLKAKGVRAASMQNRLCMT
eukprot:scaffold6953_cov32-Tisochrysis_lutea.AAC.1